MKAYLGTVKGMLIAWFIYRFSFFFTLTGNLLYMTLIYFLWKSIYAGSKTIRGMTFNQTFIYLAVAGSLFILFTSGTDWMISNRIIDGSLIMDLLKPVDFQFLTLARTAGFSIFNLCVITVPSLLVLFLGFRADMKTGIGLLFFPVGILLSFLISFAIDFSIGLTSFYTESLWGISTTKTVITSLLSGALIPLPFFPQAVQNILRLLPFQAIYNIPLSMVTSPNLGVLNYGRALAVQVFWVVALFAFCRWFYRRAFKVLTVSGG
jgi:ABC-2 type transport system permease protein